MWNLPPFFQGILVQDTSQWCALGTLHLEAKVEPCIIGVTVSFGSILRLGNCVSRVSLWAMAAQMRYWKEGLHPNDSHFLAFQYLGVRDSKHEVRLVDVGLPDRVGDSRRKPEFGPVIHMVQRGGYAFKKFALYMVMTPEVQSNVLIIREPGVRQGCCRIPSGRDDVDSGWIELFCGGMGAWSFACEAIGHKVAISVDNDPLACEGYERNHGLRPFREDVSDAGWVPFEPVSGFTTVPNFQQPDWGRRIRFIDQFRMA